MNWVKAAQAYTTSIGRLGADAAGGISNQEILVISAPKRWSFGIKDLWKHRHIVWVLIWRDLKSRYKQTTLGAAWAILQPLSTVAVFTFVFGRLARVPSGGVPYPIFVLAGLLPWQFLAQGIIRGGNSLVQERYLLTRIPIPRLALPISGILSGLPDLAVGSSALLGLMIFYGPRLELTILWLVPLLLLCIGLAMGVGLLVAALNVRFRDVGYTIPFLVQLWFFITPVAYPSGLVPPKWRALYALNPMGGVIDGFRWAVLRGTGIPSASIAISVLDMSLLLVLALFCFHRMERTFADVV